MSVRIDEVLNLGEPGNLKAVVEGVLNNPSYLELVLLIGGLLAKIKKREQSPEKKKDCLHGDFPWLTWLHNSLLQ